MPMFPDGLAVIPCNPYNHPEAPKAPVRGYQPSQWREGEVMPYSEAYGLLMGKRSGNLYAIDYDTKNEVDNDNTFKEFKALVDTLYPDLWEQLIIQSTPSGGRHVIYRVNSPVGGNKKLAMANQKNAIIESRGEGGYILVHPSLGYELVQGDLSNIPVITSEQHEAIIQLAQSLTKTLPLEAKKKVASPTMTGITPSRTTISEAIY